MKRISPTFKKDALALVAKKLRLYQKARDARKQAEKINETILEIEKELRKHDLYFCGECKGWYKWADMIPAATPLGLNNCKKCSDEHYFMGLAKASICNAGISLYDAPTDLIEIEKLRIKIRHAIKNRKHLNTKK